LQRTNVTRDSLCRSLAPVRAFALDIKIDQSAARSRERENAEEAQTSGSTGGDVWRHVQTANADTHTHVTLGSKSTIYFGDGGAITCPIK